MARADLNAMLGRLGGDDATDSEPPEFESAASTRPSKSSSPKRKTPQENSAVNLVADESGNAEVEVVNEAPRPLYMRLERKETRLRADQYAKLTEHARRLSRAKADGSARITENTLIRVAIDMLLDHADSLAGSTEGELRNSVTL